MTPEMRRSFQPNRDCHQATSSVWTTELPDMTAAMRSARVDLPFELRPSIASKNGPHEGRLGAMSSPTIDAIGCDLPGPKLSSISCNLTDLFYPRRANGHRCRDPAVPDGPVECCPAALGDALAARSVPVAADAARLHGESEVDAPLTAHLEAVSVQGRSHHAVAGAQADERTRSDDR